jgi:hypothetical protein
MIPELYTVLRKLIFSESLTLQPGSYIAISYREDLADMTAMDRYGKVLGNNTVYYKTITLWEENKQISETYPEHIVYGEYGGVMGFDGEYHIPAEYSFDLVNAHGCNIAIVCLLDSIFSSPVMRDKYKLIRRVYNAVKTNEDYWILHGPEPTLKRLAQNITAKNTRVSYENIEKVIKRLESSGAVSIEFANIRRSLKWQR